MLELQFIVASSPTTPLATHLLCTCRAGDGLSESPTVATPENQGRGIPVDNGMAHGLFVPRGCGRVQQPKASHRGVPHVAASRQYAPWPPRRPLVPELLHSTSAQHSACTAASSRVVGGEVASGNTEFGDDHRDWLGRPSRTTLALVEGGELSQVICHCQSIWSLQSTKLDSDCRAAWRQGGRILISCVSESWSRPGHGRQWTCSPVNCRR